MLVINRILGELSQKIEGKKITEQDIDSAEGDSGAKEQLKGLLNKLADKSQNEIAETLFSAIQTQGIPLVLLLIELAK
jgi:D-alanyl-D-alanine carboxypeptidase